MNKKYLDKFIDSLPLYGPQKAVCIVYQNGKEIYFKSIGGMKRSSLCYIFSCTKPITCTAALQLHEQGLFDMNDSVSKYLPEFKNAFIIKNGKPNPPKTEISIKHLFTMTAGLTYDRDTVFIDEVYKNTNGKCPTRQTVGAFIKQPLLFEPGTHWNYSLCHDVLGAVIEVISGMKLGDYLKKYIFEPCNMKSTGFEIKSPLKLDDFYINDESGIHKSDAQTEFLKQKFKFGTEYESGGAGLISNAEDYINFASTLANNGITPSGTRIISPASISLMKTNHLDINMVKDMKWSQLKGYGYGLGVRTMIDRTQGGSLSPLGEFGWSGYAGSYTIMDTDNNIALFYIQQMIESCETFTSIRLRNILYSSI